MQLTGKWNLPLRWAPVAKLPDDRANLPRVVPDDAWMTLKEHRVLGKPYQEVHVFWVLDDVIHLVICEGWIEPGNDDLAAQDDSPPRVVDHERIARRDITRQHIELPEIDNSWLERRDGRRFSADDLPFPVLLNQGFLSLQG